jgi:hypothetical protein
MGWERGVTRTGEKRDAYRALAVKLHEKRPLGRHKRRWDDKTEMDPRE